MQTPVYTDFTQLARLRLQARQDRHGALEEAAKQFEAMFLELMLKQMRQASPGDPIFA
ncbi:MAG TPA: flagellar assembly peptidoglycan hydrolase FlgJ, partial [Acidobacteria bacterium]|nr:flagellar assembly peptidoglycan hydrolase FlgJ [Acidobacteriota bacterium]